MITVAQLERSARYGEWNRAKFDKIVVDSLREAFREAVPHSGVYVVGRAEAEALLYMASMIEDALGGSAHPGPTPYPGDLPKASETGSYKAENGDSGSSEAEAPQEDEDSALRDLERPKAALPTPAAGGGTIHVPLADGSRISIRVGAEGVALRVYNNGRPMSIDDLRELRGALDLASDLALAARRWGRTEVGEDDDD